MKLLSLTGLGLAAVLGIVCLPLAAVAQTTPATAPQLNARDVGDKLVEAIIMVESQGDPRRVGSLGERGLMQIRLATWRETSREVFGRPQPFQKAFDPALNRRIGRAYLARLQTRLAQRRADWQSDERSLLIAAYNGGPTLLSLKKFDVKQMPASTRDYVERVTNLHDAMVAELTRAGQERQAAQRLTQRAAAASRVASL
jgi:soluble lytic murein transglycosylase-like protein